MREAMCSLQKKKEKKRKFTSTYVNMPLSLKLLPSNMA